MQDLWATYLHPSQCVIGWAFGRLCPPLGLGANLTTQGALSSKLTTILNGFKSIPCVHNTEYLGRNLTQ